MKLLNHYRNILRMAGLRSDDEGNIRRAGSATTDDKAKLLFIQGKPVVLPIYEQLSAPTIAERLVFHPFAESSSKGESVVVNELRQRFCSTLGFATMSLMTKFVEAGASKAEHHKFNPIQSEMLDCLRKIEERNASSIISFFTKLLNMKDKKNVAIIQIYLSRSAQVEGKDYARAGIVTFPLYNTICEELTKTKDRSIEGIKMTEKDLQYIKNLFEYIFPKLGTDKHAFDRGSTSSIAPYMHALMCTVANLEQMINEKVRLFESVIKDDLVLLPEDWIDAIDELDSLNAEIITIPLQPGTDGAARVSDLIAQKNQMNLTATPNIHQQMVQSAQPVAQAPVAAAQTMQPMQNPAALVGPQLNPHLQGMPAYPMQAMYPGMGYMQPPMMGGMGQMPMGMQPMGMMGQPPMPAALQTNLNPYSAQNNGGNLIHPSQKSLWG